MAYGWRQEALAENAQEIRNVGEELYARLSVFSEHLTKLGKSLGMAVGDYNKAIGSYETKLLPGARKFVDRGWAATARSNHRSKWIRRCATSNKAEPPGTHTGAIFLAKLKWSPPSPMSTPGTQPGASPANSARGGFADDRGARE